MCNIWNYVFYLRIINLSQFKHARTEQTKKYDCLFLCVFLGGSDLDINMNNLYNIMSLQYNSINAEIIIYYQFIIKLFI